MVLGELFKAASRLIQLITTLWETQDILFHWDI